MALPKFNSTIYNIIVPSTKQPIKFMPFKVAQQKALLIAQQSDDQTVMVNTLKSVIKECVVDEVDVNKLATFDLEYIFLQIRAKSVDEIVELVFTCKECKHETPIKFDITKINVEYVDGHSTKIELGSNIGIVMKYPNIDILKDLDNSENIDKIFDIVVSCIDYIYDENQHYYAKEQTKAELEDFVNSLTSAQFESVQRFFETMPKLQHKVEYDCSTCNCRNEIVLQGMNSFF